MVIVVASDVLGGVFPVFFWEGGVLGGVGSVFGCLTVVVCGCRWEECGGGWWLWFRPVFALPPKMSPARACFGHEK